jgi:hypothetical protein
MHAPNSIAARLAELKREVRREWQPRIRAVRRSVKRATSRESLLAVLFALLKAAAAIVLPFLVYVRASVYLYLHHVARPWIAIALAGILTVGLVSGTILLVARPFHRHPRVSTVARWAAVPLVFTWCVYSAFYLSRVNTKSDSVRAYYGSVNPILRIALSTIVLVDPDLVVTDMGRVAAGYRRMRLPVNERTKHYRQPNGYVHAVDLRTRGRWEIRNRAVQLYFWAMGFSTLRHVGTADHLHVQLAAPA